LSHRHLGALHLLRGQDCGLLLLLRRLLGLLLLPGREGGLLLLKLLRRKHGRLLRQLLLTSGQHGLLHLLLDELCGLLRLRRLRLTRGLRLSHLPTAAAPSALHRPPVRHHSTPWRAAAASSPTAALSLRRIGAEGEYRPHGQCGREG